MVVSQIPIENIYYLLCYAWDRLAEGEVVDVSRIDSTELADLFASVLVSGIHHVQRRGMEAGYEVVNMDLRGVRARVDVAGSARRLLLAHGRVSCAFDELTPNTAANQIIRATVRLLVQVQSLDERLRPKLRTAYRSLEGIDDIRLSRLSFRQVQLHGNTRFYRFLMNVCEMVVGSLLPDESSGTYRFKDFTRDPKRMALLFESFVRNRHECAELDVGRERVRWNIDGASEGAQDYLPVMETDVSVRSDARTLVIECKYYEETLGRYFDSEKVRSGHLYQLLAYLANLEARGGNDRTAAGVILYPCVNHELCLDYEMQGHTVGIRTVDLALPWRSVREQLLGIVASYGLSTHDLLSS